VNSVALQAALRKTSGESVVRRRSCLRVQWTAAFHAGNAVGWQ
jgi:hypothetical protein